MVRTINGKNVNGKSDQWQERSMGKTVTGKNVNGKNDQWARTRLARTINGKNDQLKERLIARLLFGIWQIIYYLAGNENSN